MIAIVMGVSGAGKTTIGQALAERLGWPFVEGDEHHPAENVAKMAAGKPLEDTDRWPWLDRLNFLLLEIQDRNESAVLACSALKESYRQRITKGIARFELVHLHGSYELIRGRVAQRRHRYMPASLLESQYATLEPPAHAIAIDVAAEVSASVAAIVAQLGR